MRIEEFNGNSPIDAKIEHESHDIFAGIGMKFKKLNITDYNLRITTSFEEIFGIEFDFNILGQVPHIYDYIDDLNEPMESVTVYITDINRIYGCFSVKNKHWFQYFRFQYNPFTDRFVLIIRDECKQDNAEYFVILEKYISDFIRIFHEMLKIMKEKPSKKTKEKPFGIRDYPQKEKPL